jgi:Protein of unknown function (DUF1598)
MFAGSEQWAALARAKATIAVAVVASFFTLSQVAQAQVIQQAVGGVLVNVDGVLSNVDLAHSAQLREARQKALAAIPGELSQPAKLRMVSLRMLDEAIAKCLEAGKPLPDEIKYLAGLERVQYVFVDPATKDVILAGPAEGWKVNELGNVVGITGGKPVLHLDDLLVALRFADGARKGGISVSIDPTAEGLARWKAFREQLKTIGNDPQATIAGLEQALGPQTISVNGVPATSRFANVLVAADYRMKRIAMNFDPAPVAGMQSYMDLIGAAGPAAVNAMPRWWLAPKYDPLLTDAEGMSWELRGPGVQTLAEEDVLTAGGQRVAGGAATSATVHRWAELMTAHYDELSKRDTVFGELKNCMDLAVVGALLMKEQLLEKANLHPKFLVDANRLGLEQYNPPKQVDSKASVVKKSKNWIICTSGGVQFQPWVVVEKHQMSAELGSVHVVAAKGRGDGWWWNASN